MPRSAFPRRRAGPDVLASRTTAAYHRRLPMTNDAALAVWCRAPCVSPLDQTRTDFRRT